MDEARYENLLDENTNLKKALSSTKHVLERTLNDYETLRQIHDDFKNQYDKLRRDNDESTQRYFLLLNDKKELESQFENTIRNFKMAIEQKQKELEDIQSKVIPSLDYDMIRIKIINELEGPQRLALESKQQEIDKLQDQVYELRRQFEILNSKYEAVRYEAEKDVRDLKDRHKLEMNDLILEIHSLQERADDTRDKDVARAMRRELDELRFRYGENENEMEESQREKDRLREEKNDILIKLNKQIEIEKSDKRNFKAENDRLVIRVRQLENEVSNSHHKTGDKHEEASRLQKENEKLYHDNENKLKQIHGLQQQIRDLEDSQTSSQTKLQEYISQTQLQNHEKHISEKNRIATLQREIEAYQRTIVELENKHRTNNFQTSKDLDIAKQEAGRVNEMYYQTQRNLELKEDEVNRLKRDLENLHDEMYYLQRKNKELTLQKDSASPATGPGARTGGGRDSELLREALNREEKLKNKVVRMKAKLRLANKKIMELLPHKILAQKDAQVILKENLIPVQPVVHAVGHPGSVLENLKSKYGIVDGFRPSVDVIPGPPVHDVRAISAKYGFGLGVQPVPVPDVVVEGYRPSVDIVPGPVGDVRALSAKYGFGVREGPDVVVQPEIDRLNAKYGFGEPLRSYGPRDEGMLQDEIERSADEAIRKYGL